MARIPDRLPRRTVEFVNGAIDFSTAVDKKAKLNIYTGNVNQCGICLQNFGTGCGVKVDQDGNGVAMCIDSEAIGFAVLRLYGKYCVRSLQDISGGYAGQFERNIAEAGSNPVLAVMENNAASTQPTFKVINAGSHSGIQILQTGNTIQGGLYIEQSGTGIGCRIWQSGVNSSQLCIFQMTNAASTGVCMYAQNAGSGNCIYVNQDGDGIALNIDTASTVIAPLRITSLAANPTGAHIIGDIAVVAGVLKICTTAGTPGTWTIVGTQA